MDPKSLINGFEFVIKHSLAKRELEVLSFFVENEENTFYASEIAGLLKTSLDTTYRIIQRLKLRGLLISKGKSSNGNILLKFNTEN